MMRQTGAETEGAVVDGLKLALKKADQRRQARRRNFVSDMLFGQRNKMGIQPLLAQSPFQPLGFCERDDLIGLTVL